MKNALDTDWPGIISFLQAKGISIPEIAKEIGCSPSAPYRWAHGSEPLYRHGHALLALRESYELYSGIHHCEK